MQPNVWTKGTRSGPNDDNCVQVLWRTATCDTASCVQVAEVEDQFWVRDTKDQGQGPVLSFSRDEWEMFIAGVKEGQFDTK